MKFKAAMPEVPKLVGGALIAVGVGGITATIADAVHSTPLIIAVWLIALGVGIVLIFYMEQRKRQMMIGAETMSLPVVDAQGAAHKRSSPAGSQVIHNTDSEDPQLSDEMDTRVDLESRTPWDTTPTSEFDVVPPSHRRLLNAQSDGDFLVWTPNYPAAETDPEMSREFSGCRPVSGCILVALRDLTSNSRGNTRRSLEGMPQSS